MSNIVGLNDLRRITFLETVKSTDYACPEHMIQSRKHVQSSRQVGPHDAEHTVYCTSAAAFRRLNWLGRLDE